MSDPTTTSRDLMDYIWQSPTAAHVTGGAVSRLEAAGFRRLDEGDRWPLEPGDRFYVVREDTALAAGQVGSAPPAEAGFRVIGAHTDSPGFRAKVTNPLDREGFAMLGVEVYGGPLLASWCDRDLGLAGRLLVRQPDGGHRTVLFRVDRPVARIPLLAIHLDRSANEKGLKLDAQKHVPPVIGLSHEDGGDRLLSTVGEAADVDPADIALAQLELFDLQRPAFGGLDEEFLFAPRIDNVAGCHAALQALIESGSPAGPGRVIILNNSEEVGSATPEGAQSTFLGTVLERLCLGGANAREDLLRALSRTILASVDGAHAVHPSYADRHEPDHRPMLNGGPVVKINAKERYATTLHTRAHVEACAERAEVPLQHYIHRTDLPCGSTIGPITATLLGIATVDLGSPMISMHSVREMGGTADQDSMIRLLKEHLKE